MRKTISAFSSSQDKSELDQEVKRQIVAYQNSGGVIQKCPAFSYSQGEIETLGSTHKRSLGLMK